METIEQYRFTVKGTPQLDKVKSMLESAMSAKMHYEVKKKHFLLCGSAVYKIFMKRRREKNFIKSMVRYGFDKKLIRSILNKKPLGTKQPYKVIPKQRKWSDNDNW